MTDRILWMVLDAKGIEIFSYVLLSVIYIWIKVHLEKTVCMQTSI